jgi:hypothetical protein
MKGTGEMTDRQILLDEIEAIKKDYVKGTKLSIEQFSILAFCIYHDHTALSILDNDIWTYFDMCQEEVKHCLTMADLRTYLSFRYANTKARITFPYNTLEDYIFFYGLRKKEQEDVSC